MAVVERFRAAITDLVEHLIQGKFGALEDDGRIGRLTKEELEEAVRDYGRELIALPDDAFDVADCYPIEGEQGVWSVDLPLWTREEGRSDLTLTISIQENDGQIKLGIDDLHVL